MSTRKEQFDQFVQYMTDAWNSFWKTTPEKTKKDEESVVEKPIEQSTPSLEDVEFFSKMKEIVDSVVESFEELNGITKVDPSSNFIIDNFNVEISVENSKNEEEISEASEPSSEKTVFIQNYEALPDADEEIVVHYDEAENKKEIPENLETYEREFI
jgi:hypothetical protein